jgi:hypothetical protein
MEVFVSRNGEQFGPFSAEQAVELLDTGKLLVSDLAWAPGLDDWQSLGSLFDTKEAEQRLNNAANRIASREHRNYKAVQLLGAARRFLNRHIRTKAVCAAIATVLLASWLYPPWIHYGRSQRMIVEKPHGWFFLFDLTQGEKYPGETVMHIDIGRLVLLSAVLLLGGGLIAFAASRNATKRHVVNGVIILLLVGLLTIPTVVAISAGQAIFRYRQKIAADGRNKARQSKIVEREAKLRQRIDKTLPPIPSASDLLVVVEGSRQLGFSDETILDSLSQKFDGYIPVRELDAGKRGYRLDSSQRSQLKNYETAWKRDALIVQPDDLKQITLFDVKLAEPPSFAAQGLAGHLRNDLPRAVKNVVIRAMFAKSDGTIIEVSTFSLGSDHTFNPGEPQNFQSDHHNIGELPSGFAWSVKVAGATYVE